jgi:hypothetical protein
MRSYSRTNNTNADSFRRVEVITGVGRRRRWSLEKKVRIVAESLDLAATSSAVARRYGLHASQLFTWAAAAAAERVDSRDERRAGVRAGADGGEQCSSSRGSGPDGDCTWSGRGTGWGQCGRRSTAAGARGGAGPAVIAIPPGVRILLAAQPVDFRKGMDGLAALVQQVKAATVGRRLR